MSARSDADLAAASGGDRTAPAFPLVAGLPGLDPAWSRRLDVVDADGIPRTWHLLERPAGSTGGAFSDTTRDPSLPAPALLPAAAPPVGTMLCLHGNPTWSYLWRRFLAAAPPGWRVLAPDQLGLGWSERLEGPRTLAQRIDDLSRLTDALDVTGPVVAVAHDWGGPVLLGWAVRHRQLLAGLVLTNTGIAVPAGTAPPALIAAARSGPLLETVCRRTPLFVRGATVLSRPPLPTAVRDAYASPYALSSRRRAVRDFVADIPLESAHPSRPALDAVVAGLADLTDVSTLLVWGARDPVFSVRYLHDLRHRLPRADVQLYPRAAHLVVEDAPEAATDVWSWVERTVRIEHPPARAAAGHAGPDNPPADGKPGPRSVRQPGNPTTDGKPGPPGPATPGTPTTDEKPGLPGPERPDDPTTDDIPDQEVSRTAPGSRPRPLWDGLLARSADRATAIAELGRGATDPITFAELEDRVAALARGLDRAGVQPGHRVALLVRPGVDLTVAVYACWRAGAAIVVADAGLGLRNLGRALRSADPDHLIAIPAGLAAAAALKVPGARIVAGELPASVRRRLRVAHSLAELTDLGRPREPGGPVEPTGPSKPTGLTGPSERAEPYEPEEPADPPPDRSRTPQPDAEAAVLFTSGATGPAKGVVYTHRQLRAQLDLVRTVCRLDPGARLVAAFPPFALYGPALGAAAAVPDMDPTKPATLTATALAEAVAAVDATVVFASPAALRNVAATADRLTPDLRARLGTVRTLLSAGAPVPVNLLRRIQSLLPQAELHTPYGMTEVLPVTDVTLADVEQARAGGGATANGVCVGRPLPGVDIQIDPLDRAGRPAGALGSLIDVTGEICVAAAHVKDHYDRLWVTQQRSVAHQGAAACPAGEGNRRWHRTGDVGHLDSAGRLWVEGRLVHVITGPAGPLTPVGPEQRIESLSEVTMAAVVGVGPAGTQQTVAVLVPAAPPSGARRVLAGADLAAAVRAVAGTPLAAVLVTDRLPVDIRHASKIDRARVARWADRVLAGRPVRGRGRRP